jgi:protein involved in polysaccharide export with SLBB domain
MSLNSIKSNIQSNLILICVVITACNCVKRVQVNHAENHSPAKDSVITDDSFFQSASLDSVHLELAAKEHSEIIFPGDQLEISIYDKLPVSQEKRTEMKRVGSNGNLLIVPIGQVKVAGLTIIKAQEIIEEKLKKIVQSPFCEISIIEREYKPLVYAFGEIPKVGAFPLKRGDRILDILSAIGGCKDAAYRRSIKIIRKVEKNKIGMYSINLYNILENGQLDENILLQDQDIIFVPRRFLTNMQEVLSALGQITPWYYFIKGLGAQ